MKDFNEFLYASGRLKEGAPLSPKQAGLVLGLSTSTIRNLINAEKLSAVRISSGRLMIPASHINDFMKVGVTA